MAHGMGVWSWWYDSGMARAPSKIKMKKVTLYLDDDAVKRIRTALEDMPGSPSFSALLSQELPRLADLLEEMRDAFKQRNFDGVLAAMNDHVHEMHAQAAEVHQVVKGVKKKTADSLPPESTAQPVPAGKAKRQKKLA